ncbi:hypothetical protein CC1G_15587 [Coprinopsis cinerea okayama7|uniref:Uncharacterized protein n=1 Tax=Coprinopsis cinerea (strain Okayama-7 / 130 / ATCC MYA-4618 / FGSC 9003) TaxID=240176 RepID=D6RN74_COPC7|nr:hypothetical protein CC1G_15587 [Coprinopsis cinerea okayama7\|eukprot:XP_002911044.1 hypothetical protein CC1G_15587 [Coprinopsis cinerea okayama7\
MSTTFRGGSLDMFLQNPTSQLTDTLVSMEGVVSMLDLRGETALDLAVQKGHAVCVEDILGSPTIDVNAEDRFGRTALVKAVGGRSQGHC